MFSVQCRPRAMDWSQLSWMGHPWLRCPESEGARHLVELLGCFAPLTRVEGMRLRPLARLFKKRVEVVVEMSSIHPPDSLAPPT